ncbi:hypothetical protein WJS89_04805 [Sphingomicrobium sp. XHP0235]|uniref:hypothetical protein n=1 Tax=Sphingomicrobium aquimarinum TaxID=3133971 RepID=UPI0031FF2A93
MTQIRHSDDCGNSPKNSAVEALAIGLEGGPWPDDISLIDAIWTSAEGDCVVGPQAIRDAAEASPVSIRIEHVTTHGKVGAVTGLCDGHAFAHVFTFTSAAAKQLASIDSYRKRAPAD